MFTTNEDIGYGGLLTKGFKKVLNLLAIALFIKLIRCELNTSVSKSFFGLIAVATPALTENHDLVIVDQTLSFAVNHML